MAKSTLTDISKISCKDTYLCEMTFGFIGLGNMGSRIVKNLMSSGHSVVLWNRSKEKCKQFEDLGAICALTPSDVVSRSDIIFSCVSNPKVAKDLVLGNGGILAEIKKGKSFVEMTGIDPKTSNDINEAVTKKQGRYMEAVIQGSITEAESGNLVIIAAGNKELFDDCQSVFCAIAKSSFYKADIGYATKMNLILNTMKAISIIGMAEAMALANTGGMELKDVIDILGFTSFNSPILLENGQAIVDKNSQKDHTLKHLQTDINLILNWSNTLQTTCPVLATIKEFLKGTIRLGYGDFNNTSICFRTEDYLK
ncbi:3-hydroxyisobutyrate dehydrogenase-related,3-hydroxyisobutyrate dehydrogenase, NAD-binding domain,6- [Cinara cedri]|uniref:Cytokine-like nuclear factor N-PAC n=1 Tax=Cinara cedri TaxID=506608 RepID=A0A5E4NM20_9HEMI|nr:3-hydroxyisobutyrate dehydrogenase-related,3-hydroxyisobutyrate dehydrogenase, NAD-binding domain,6- [Cinara cedri]VVC42541.1 3-hydroxyisobutyrate dehydrogenase-related,3-hydroxyisobutyrate dehydrogenase, NAD-binding domain,6- [Cinara cedri]